MPPVSERRRNGQQGFMLLFVFLLAAAAALSLYMEMPRVAFESQRLREELLVERGLEYRRAIQLYVRKKRQYPPNIDALEKDGNLRFLRRRFVDPLTGKDEWRLIHIGPNGEFTDSLIHKPKNPLEGEKSGYNNTFITEGPSLGSQNVSTNTGAGNSIQNRIRASEQAGAPGQTLPGTGGPAGPVDPNQPQQQSFSEAQPGGYFNGPPPAPDPNQQQQQPVNPFLQQQMQQMQQPQPNDPSQVTQSAYAQTGQPQPVNQPGQTPYPTSVFPGGQPPGFTPPPVGFVPPGVAQQGQGPQQQQGQQQPGAPFNPVGQFVPGVGSAGGVIGRGPVGYVGNTQVPANSQTGGVVPQQQFGMQPYNPQANAQNQAPPPFTPYNPGGNFGQQPQTPRQPTGPNQPPISLNPAVGQQIMGMLTRPSTTGTAGANMPMGMGGLGAGIAGVASKHEGEGIKLINDRSLYKEWEFLYDAARDPRASGVNMNTQGTPGTMGSGTTNAPTLGGSSSGGMFGGKK
jgi:hypothetical protein